jgi:alpha-galactosidase
MTHEPVIALNEDALQLAYRFDDGDLRLTQLAHAGHAWLAGAALPFAVFVDGNRVDDWRVTHADTGAWRDGMLDLTLEVRSLNGLTVTHHTRAYEDTPLIEMWQTVRNAGANLITITRVDSCALKLAPAQHDLLFFTSDWGAEFEPVRTALTQDMLLETKTGRSSKGMHPWCALFREDGAVLSAAIAWSGNWRFRLMPMQVGAKQRTASHADIGERPAALPLQTDQSAGIAFSAGLSDWEFAKALHAGDKMESPKVVIALGHAGDLNTTSKHFARVGRKHWYPKNATTEALPVEWNHWWSYEDKLINETVFRENAAKAAEMGIGVCTLDAGWFGPSDPSTHWYDLRGDWHLVNQTRFPNGIRAVADDVHARGMKFGLWCEIEALGKLAQLADDRPELVALRDGERLGYVCMGNSAAQDWAFETLRRLIEDYACDWIKLDFNLDPGAGCNRTDHGHGAGDGLFEHYSGYYTLLQRVRAAFPEVILENCSSGGLRIDLGLQRHTHMTFLSDPDWPAHDLQLFWGATTMLAPNDLLHWGYCEWINGHPTQQFNPRDPNLKKHQLDYYTRMSMMNAFGFSQKLPELPEWVEQRWKEHIRIYKSHISRFVREADVIRLTEQPRRDSSGDRWSAFQFAMPAANEHLLFVFHMPNGEAQRSFALRELDAECMYQLEWLGDDKVMQAQGSDLMSAGMLFTLPEEGSALVWVKAM